MKEENAKLYRVSSYFFGKMIIDVPLLLIFPICFALSIYWMVGFNITSADRVVTFSTFFSVHYFILNKLILFLFNFKYSTYLCNYGFAGK